MSSRAVHRGRRAPSSEPEGTQFPLTTSNAILWLCRELLLPWVTPGRSWGRRKKSNGDSHPSLLSCSTDPRSTAALPPLTRGLHQPPKIQGAGVSNIWSFTQFCALPFTFCSTVSLWDAKKAPPASSPQPGFIFTTSFPTGRCQTSPCIFFCLEHLICMYHCCSYMV